MRKYSFWKKSISLALSIAMIVLMIPTTAFAKVNSTSKFSKPYKNSVYYTRLVKAKNTTGGDLKKFVAIVESQAGYHEGYKYTDLDGCLSNGTTTAKKLSYLSGNKYKNYNGYLDTCEYNFWYYGASDNSKVTAYTSSTKTVSGAKYPVSKYDRAWCAAFVSWCAAQADVISVIPSSAGCGSLRKGIINKGGKVVKESERKPGDILFYYCPTCKQQAHVGVVSSNIKYSIEGNSNDIVDKVNLTKKNTHTCMKKGHPTQRVYVRPALCDHSSTYSKVVQKATCQRSGSKKVYCKECNELIATKTINRTGHKYDKYNHCSICGEYYPLKGVDGKRGVYRTTSSVVLRKTPYTKGKGGSSNKIISISSSKMVIVQYAGKNKSGTLWYYASYKNDSGKTYSGFVSSKNLKFVQDSFAFYEGKTKLFNVVVGGTPEIPRTSVDPKESGVVKGFNLYKKSGTYSNRYYTESGKWLTASDAKKKGETYKLFKPGSGFVFNEEFITKHNKYATKYYLVPVWEEEASYIVKFDANGGENAPEAQRQVVSKSVKIPWNQPTREGYIFKGWSTSPNGSVYYAPLGYYTQGKDVTLYAIWIKSPIHWNSVYAKNVTATSALIGCTVTADCSRINRIGLQIRKSNRSWGDPVASWKVGSVLEYCTVQCGGKNAEAPALESKTTYYYRFYVETTDAGIIYTDEKPLTTL